MKKLFLLGVMSLILIIVLVFVFAGMSNKTTAATGYSTEPNEVDAVKEAVSMVTEKIPKPDYLILFSTVEDKSLGLGGYDSEKILSETNKLLPNTKIFGGTSHLAVLTKEGYHQSNNGALAMMGISSKDIIFGVGGADISDYSSAREAGKAAMQEALRDAGREGEYPDLVLIMGSLGNEEELLLGVEDVIGWGVPVIGGSAADNTQFSGIWREYTKDKSYVNGVTLTAIFTDLEIGYAYESGFEKQQDKRGVITRAEGRKIYEINNMPAGDVFNEWCDGCVASKLETGGSTMPESALYALGKVVKSGSMESYLSVAIVGVGENKSLDSVANLINGDEVTLMNGVPESLINNAKRTTQNAMLSKNITKGNPILAFAITCAGLQLSIPTEDLPDLPYAVSSEVGDNVPVIGAFTDGEQGPLGIVNRHGNLINVRIIFSEKE